MSRVGALLSGALQPCVGHGRYYEGTITKPAIVKWRSSVNAWRIRRSRITGKLAASARENACSLHDDTSGTHDIGGVWLRQSGRRGRDGHEASLAAFSNPCSFLAVRNLPSSNPREGRRVEDERDRERQGPSKPNAGPDRERRLGDASQRADKAACELRGDGSKDAAIGLVEDERKKEGECWDCHKCGKH